MLTSPSKLISDTLPSSLVPDIESRLSVMGQVQKYPIAALPDGRTVHAFLSGIGDKTTLSVGLEPNGSENQLLYASELSLEQRPANGTLRKRIASAFLTVAEATGSDKGTVKQMAKSVEQLMSRSGDQNIYMVVNDPDLSVQPRHVVLRKSGGDIDLSGVMPGEHSDYTMMHTTVFAKQQEPLDQASGLPGEYNRRTWNQILAS